MNEVLYFSLVRKKKLHSDTRDVVSVRRKYADVNQVPGDQFDAPKEEKEWKVGKTKNSSKFVLDWRILLLGRCMHV